MTLLHGLGVPELFSPELTAEWEFKLAQMEHGKLKRDVFMREIVAMTQHIVGQAKGYESDTIPGDFGTLTARCPNCGGEVHENYKKFQVPVVPVRLLEDHGRAADRRHGSRYAAARATARSLDGFRSRLGKPFLRLDPFERRQRGGLRLRRRRQRRFGRGAGFHRPRAARPCPKCKSRVFETAQAYVCEKAVGPDKTCDFRSGRVILQRPVERAQMEKLLATGKTDLLQFVSARTKRGFSAFLVRQPDGKIGFEFEARDPAKAGARRARAAPAALRVLGPHPRDKKPVELIPGVTALCEARRRSTPRCPIATRSIADARRGGDIARRKEASRDRPRRSGAQRTQAKTASEPRAVTAGAKARKPVTADPWRGKPRQRRSVKRTSTPRARRRRRSSEDQAAAKARRISAK
jgi:DNA topoisomerase-3